MSDETRVAPGDEFEIVRAFSDEPPDTSTAQSEGVGYARFLDDEGFVERHLSTCASRNGGTCNCTPSFDAVGAASDAELGFKDVERYSGNGKVQLLEDLLGREVGVAQVFGREGLTIARLASSRFVLERLSAERRPRVGEEWLQASAEFDDLCAQVRSYRENARAEDEIAAVMGAEPGALPDRNDEEETLALILELDAEQRRLLRDHADRPRNDDVPRPAAERMKLMRLKASLRRQLKQDRQNRVT